MPHKKYSPYMNFLSVPMNTNGVYYMFFFNKHIRIQGLCSDMLKVTQNIGWKYVYDMLILCVKIFKMGAKSVRLSHIAYIVIHKL